MEKVSDEQYRKCDLTSIMKQPLIEREKNGEA